MVARRGVARVIDRNLDMRIAGGDPLALRYRRQLADGTTRELLGEVYAFTIYRADGSTADGWSAASTIERDLDGDYADMALAPTLSVALAGTVGLKWALDEVLPDGGRQARQGGALYVSRSPTTIAGTASPLARADIDWIIERDDER
ncbi:hypothetical protein [Sphingomonas sp. R86521]|uniref:hypothetical protein n=1 Tax=Sphingomonas sp. R86521 TaxID=3093860 RepID=UPI0036D328D0